MIIQPMKLDIRSTIDSTQPATTSSPPATTSSPPSSTSSSSTSLTSATRPDDVRQFLLASQMRRVLRRERKETVKRLREYNWALAIVGRKLGESERLRYRCSLNWLIGRIQTCQADLRRNRRQERLLETAVVIGTVHRVQEMREWWWPMATASSWKWGSR